MRPTILFTHLKIILLQCFQYLTINGIQTDLNYMFLTGWTRFCYIKSSMLWPRPLQWTWNMQSTVKSMPKPEHLCVLGSFSSNGACKPAHCSADHDWFHRVHEPDEPEHHYGHGLQELISSIIII